MQKICRMFLLIMNFFRIVKFSWQTYDISRRKEEILKSRSRRYVLSLALRMNARFSTVPSAASGYRVFQHKSALLREYVSSVKLHPYNGK
jgi:hypothetical protein